MYATASKNSESTTSTARQPQAHDSGRSLQRKGNGHDTDALVQLLAQADPAQASDGSPAIYANSPSDQLSRLVKTSAVQPKLKIGKPNDRFEQEADQMADKVMVSPSPGAQPSLQLQTAESHPSNPLLQRQAEEEEEESVQAKSLLQRQPAEEEEENVQAKSLIRRQAEEEEEAPVRTKSLLQRQPAEEEEEAVQAKALIQREAEEEEEPSVQAKSLLQRQAAEEEEEEVQAKFRAQRQADEEEDVQAKEMGEGAGVVSGSLEPRLGAGQGGGQALSPGVQSHMGSVIGADFSNVRVHTDRDAVQMSSALNAQAFTYGSDIYFNQGNYDPDSSQGRRLLSHELTHVVQQGKAGAQTPAIAQKSLEEEQEKEDVEVQAKAETGEISAAPVGIQRGIWDSIAGAAGAVWDATAGQLVDAAGNVIQMTSDLFWSLLENVAPGFVSILREIARKGIIGFLKDKISQALNHIFDGLSDGSGTLTPLFATFKEMIAQAAVIVVALANGDCKPLFAAVNQLKDTVSKMAGAAWKAVTDFFAPIGAFFSDVWQSFGAPVLDWLGQTAKDVWEYIKGLGLQIWAWTQPVRDAVGGAWDWVKGKLGIGGKEGDGDSEGGLVQWIQGKAEEAWGFIKEQLQPVVEPIQAVVEKVQAILPLDAIFNLRETIQGWLSKAEAMGQAMGEDGSNVAEEQTSLRDEILPAVLARIESLRAGLIRAGLWVSEKIGSMVLTVTGFITSLSSSPLLSGLRSAVMWIQTGLQQLAEWAQTKVIALFNLIGDGLVQLSKFIRPILDVLNQIVETLKNLMGKLPDLILGPVWWILPDCIKNPIKDFILNQILKRIPFFQQFMALGDIWAKVKATAMKILKQIFVDGNLFGALWTYFKAVLGIFNIPPQLVPNIIIKAAQALGDILSDPIGFVINILKALKEGFVRFFSNILKHLFGGVVDWLFGQMQDAGITIPKDFSLKSILGLVFQILGITVEKIWKKLADKIGQDKVDKLKKAIEYATGAWEWIKLAVKGGPAAIWEKLKEKLSDLWSSVITGVVGWINKVIVFQASKWLLSLLDVSGITPTINALIAIYKAIESFFQYLKQMLEIVNTVLNGIADLAKGAISAAAGFLESALAKSVPIIIGFLANQFGLGRLGHRLREIIGAIQKKVDGAIEWIINKAINTGKTFLNALKSGAAAVKGSVKGLFEWWKRKQKFITKDGREHSLYFIPDGKKLTLMVASSNAQNVYDLLNNNKKEDDPSYNNKVDQGIKAYEKTVEEQDKLLQIEANRDAYEDFTSYRSDHRSQETILYNELYELGKKLEPLQLSPVMIELVRSRTVFDTASSGNPEWAEGFPITSVPGTSKGSEAHKSNRNDPLGYYHALDLNDAATGRGSWVRGHLLAKRLHGPGTVGSINLMPLLASVNDDMSIIENQAYDKIKTRDKAIWYRTTVRYQANDAARPYMKYFPHEVEILWGEAEPQDRSGTIDNSPSRWDQKPEDPSSTTSPLTVDKPEDLPAVTAPTSVTEMSLKSRKATNRFFRSIPGLSAPEADRLFYAYRNQDGMPDKDKYKEYYEKQLDAGRFPKYYLAHKIDEHVDSDWQKLENLDGVELSYRSREYKIKTGL